MSSYKRRDKGALWGLYHKGTKTMHEDSTHNLNHVPKVLSPNTITLEARISTYAFEEDTNIQSVSRVQYLQAKSLLTTSTNGTEKYVYSLRPGVWLPSYGSCVPM